MGFYKIFIKRRWVRNLGFKRFLINLKPVVQIFYKGKPLNKVYQPDFVCYDEIIVEIKAISSLTGLEEAQLINYLKATGMKVGLLINFGSKSLEHKRLVYNL